MQLRLIDKKVGNNQLKSLRVELMFAPGTAQAFPRIADIRVSALPCAALVGVERGQALIDAQKDFYLDPLTQKPWRTLAPGLYQVLLMSVVNTATIGAGVLATLEFSANCEAVEIRLLRRDQVFAPPEADAVLQSSDYDRPLVATK